jgi:hypothetical protein
MSVEKMVDVEIDIDDDLFLAVAKEAHKQNITFNQMVNIILKKKLEEEEEEKNK